jgi:hypothetical protein
MALSEFLILSSPPAFGRPALDENHVQSNGYVSYFLVSYPPAGADPPWMKRGRS